jgi:hypothetical protein
MWKLCRWMNTKPQFVEFSRVHVLRLEFNVQCDHKLRKRLHTFWDKKVISTQKSSIVKSNWNYVSNSAWKLNMCSIYIALQQLHSVRQGSKAFANNFPHTWLWLVQLAARLRSWLPSTSPISPQNTISYFHTGNRSALHKQPVPTRFKPLSDQIRGRSYIQFILKIIFYKF